MNLPKRVEIIESGLRDGIQNEKIFIPTDSKLQLIHALSETGIKRMEATSFVSHQTCTTNGRWIRSF
ncbi:hypothetical protein KEH51_25610 [[Brevibacterium] frigoritolerans]|uniref:Pyruvate carboxyltransferase domain-containing protein n=1 Tax=Peribacillus frigoritolerans TaxID=450367 RepID=A0A941J3L0_9BACI|nr:hypothetical protein [Peribacillus frigoritolerans]